MRIKLYSFLALIYLLFVAGLSYKQNLGEYALDFFGFVLNFSITFWVVLPALLLFIFSLLHMSFYSFLRFLKFKNYANDALKFEKFTADLVLKKESKNKFKSEEFIKAAKLCKAIYTCEPCEDEKIDLLLALRKDIDEGRVVELKNYALAKDNELVLKNLSNKIKNDLDFAALYLKGKSELKDEFDKLAFKELLKGAKYELIKELKIKKSEAEIYALFLRYEAKSLALNTAEIEVLLDFNELSEENYYKISKILAKNIEPEILIALFEKLSQKHENAFLAYLYLLANFSLFDTLRSKINSKDEDFDDFSLIIFLRDNNKIIDPALIIDARFK